MMHGFGDCRKPLSETAALIETIVHQQMSSLLQQATEVSELRGSSRGVCPEDVLFVIRKDHLKLQRLVNYMGVRDLYQRTSALSSGTVSKDFVDATSETESSRKKICASFLQSIDQVGEYDSICAGTLIDPIRTDRVLRYDSMAQGMSSHRYKEYCEARRASFCPRLRVNKFKEWLLSDDNSEIKLTQGTMLQGNVDTNRDIKVGMDPITPSEVREAIRRYWANNSVLAPFSKNRSPIGTRLLAG